MCFIWLDINIDFVVVFLGILLATCWCLSAPPCFSGEASSPRPEHSDQYSRIAALPTLVPNQLQSGTDSGCFLTVTFVIHNLFMDPYWCLTRRVYGSVIPVSDGGIKILHSPLFGRVRPSRRSDRPCHLLIISWFCVVGQTPCRMVHQLGLRQNCRW